MASDGRDPWEGFITESKAYVGYEPGRRLAFWFAFPLAALRYFVTLPLRDLGRRVYAATWRLTRG